MRILLVLCMMMVSSVAWGQSSNSSLNLNIPQAPQTYASDQIRAGDLDCRMAIGSSTPNSICVGDLIGIIQSRSAE